MFWIEISIKMRWVYLSGTVYVFKRVILGRDNICHDFFGLKLLLIKVHRVQSEHNRNSETSSAFWRAFLILTTLNYLQSLLDENSNATSLFNHSEGLIIPSDEDRDFCDGIENYRWFKNSSWHFSI